MNAKDYILLRISVRFKTYLVSVSDTEIIDDIKFCIVTDKLRFFRSSFLQTFNNNLPTNVDDQLQWRRESKYENPRASVDRACALAFWRAAVRASRRLQMATATKSLARARE